MSLTAHIIQGKKSPIGKFLCENFGQTRSITKEANRQLRNASTVLSASESVPYPTLGMAIDYRIRYYFAVTPSERLTARRGSGQLILRPLVSEEDIPIPEDELMDLLSNHFSSWSFDLSAGAAYGPYSWELLESFFHDLDRTLAAIQPSGRRLDTTEEQMLGRYCYVLALFEQVSRQGLSYNVLTGPLFKPTAKSSVQELLAIPQDEWVEDLCAMSWLFYDRCRDLLAQPAVLNPLFAGSSDVGGADADLIIDRCLIELKASKNATLPANWLRQLAGYVLLDYEDTYQIDTVGIYMIRQGIMFRWPVEEFFQTLTGDPLISVAALRQKFRTRFNKKPKRTRASVGHPL